MEPRVEDILELAVCLGKQSSCNRGKVGAVILCTDGSIVWGRNDAPTGTASCRESNHGFWGMEKAPGCIRAAHAEANAIGAAARYGVPISGGTLFVKCTPCLACSKLIVAAGIKQVIALKYHKNTEGLDLLSEAGITLRVNEHPNHS